MRRDHAVLLTLLTTALAGACGDDDKGTSDTGADTREGDTTLGDTTGDTARPDGNDVIDSSPEEAADTSEGDTIEADTMGDSADSADTDVGPPAPEWSCLGDVSGDPPTTETVDVVLEIVDMLTRAGLEGVAVKVCRSDDPSCAAPVHELTSAADGAVTVALEVQPAGFSGFAELTKDGYVDVLALANVPITTGPQTSPVRLAMVKTTELPAAAALLGATLDPTRGQLLAATWDCAERPASGASLALTEADAATVPFYLASGVPSASATETDASGGGGFVNVPVGAATVTMSVDGAFAGVGVAPIRAGWVTQMIMVPTPEPDRSDWSCLGNVVGDPPLAETLDLALRVIDFVTREPLPGVAIKVCSAADQCATPVAELVTDADGEATPTITVMPSGFRGYAELTCETCVSMLLQANVPITDGPPSLPLLVPMVQTSELPVLAALLQTTLDPQRGHLNVPTWDCAELPAAGVAIAVAEADAMSTAFYVASGLPSISASATDATGAGGFVNLPAGPIHVTNTLDGAFVGAGVTEIRAGWLTSFIMLPTPAPE